MRAEYTPEALLDLDAIFDVTHATWGEDQAIEYISHVQHVVNALVDNPQMGIVRSDIAVGIRTFLVERHRIVYELEPPRLIIHAFVHVNASDRSIRRSVTVRES